MLLGNFRNSIAEGGHVISILYTLQNILRRILCLTDGYNSSSTTYDTALHFAKVYIYIKPIDQ